jgi:alkanesulfonate monooxygenase SsuD/methylene tetrahydromethanopterin reductase-like flavin-dependent oxidoreductase (luciferase family)
MKVSIGIGGAASGRKRDFDEQVNYVVEAEKLGVDAVWTAEAWGQDAIAPLAYLGAKTSRIKLGTGIMQISARGTGDDSDDRVDDGGDHQRQVSARPRRQRSPGGRRVARSAVQGAADADEGNHRHHQAGLRRREDRVPRAVSRAAATGWARQGAAPVATRQPNIPIYLATLGPATLEYTGAAADGWLGTSFTPEHADAHLDYLRRGAKSAGRNFADIDIQVGGTVAFGDDMAALVEPLKPGMAFTLGAMGSPTTNFYNDAFKRGGWDQVGREVQKLWVSGKREEAIAKVPAEMVIQANLLGDEATVRARIRAYRDAGVTTLRVAPAGAGLEERLTTLGRVMDIVRGI